MKYKLSLIQDVLVIDKITIPTDCNLYITETTINKTQITSRSKSILIIGSTILDADTILDFDTILGSDGDVIIGGTILDTGTILDFDTILK